MMTEKYWEFLFPLKIKRKPKFVPGETVTTNMEANNVILETRGRKQSHFHPEALNEEGLYECVRCGYKTQHPSRYTSHINTVGHKISGNPALVKMLQEIKV